MFLKNLNKNLLLISITLLFSCSIENRFVKRDLVNLSTLGVSKFFTHNDYEFCKKIDPNFIIYKNGVNPTRTCIHYGYYKCHIENYCKGDKDCENDVKRYWIADWKDKYGNWTDPVEATKTYCERIKKQCDLAEYGDQTCRK